MNPLSAALRFWKLRSSWLGDGGQPVPQTVANTRASICLTCPKNQLMPLWENLTTPVANTLRKQIQLKAQMQLVVPGEDGLHSCKVCGCVNSLAVWCPDQRIRETLHELDGYPPHCWKLACKAP